MLVSPKMEKLIEAKNVETSLRQKKNELSHNSPENGGMTRTIMAPLLKMVALCRGSDPYNHVEDAVTKYLVIPDLTQWDPPGLINVGRQIFPLMYSAQQGPLNSAHSQQTNEKLAKDHSIHLLF